MQLLPGGEFPARDAHDYLIIIFYNTVLCTICISPFMIFDPARSVHHLLYTAGNMYRKCCATDYRHNHQQLPGQYRECFVFIDIYADNANIFLWRTNIQAVYGSCMSLSAKT